MKNNTSRHSAVVIPKDMQLTLAEIREPKRRQLVHTARQMFETRWAKYNDPHNEDWDFDEVIDKWERHAWSAFLDLVAVEKERDALLSTIDTLQQQDALVDEVRRRMDVVVDAAVEWYNAGREGKEWGLNEAEVLDNAIESLLELREKPATKSALRGYNPERGKSSRNEPESESESSVSGEIEDENDEFLK